MNNLLIEDYEQGLLDEDEVIAFFQDLISTGAVWQLEGHYGRTAATLIAAGECHA